MLVLNPPTPFQLRAQSAIDQTASALAIKIEWAEEAGPLHKEEMMLVGRAAGGLTVWLYEDSVDYQLGQSAVVNFEGLNFTDQSELLTEVRDGLQRAFGTRHEQRI
jgi:dienelactone hydrolase